MLVIAVAARIAKLFAAPKVGDVAPSGFADTSDDGPPNERDIARIIEIVRYFSLGILFGLLPKTSAQRKDIEQYVLWSRHHLR
jgi:hypothetical protein